MDKILSKLICGSITTNKAIDALLENGDEEEEDSLSKSATSDQKKKLVTFVKSHPNLEDEDFHEYAEKLGLSPHAAEEVIYAHVHKTEAAAIPGGLARSNTPSDFSAKELKMGVKVEKEHLVGGKYSRADAFKKAREIAMDHLKEIPDYYTRLKKMEQEAEDEEEVDEAIDYISAHHFMAMCKQGASKKQALKKAIDTTGYAPDAMFRFRKIQDVEPPTPETDILKRDLSVRGLSKLPEVD